MRHELSDKQITEKVGGAEKMAEKKVELLQFEFHIDEDRASTLIMNARMTEWFNDLVKEEPEPVEELKREKIPIEAANKPTAPATTKTTITKKIERLGLVAHGGKRENAGRKKANKETKKPETQMIRVDKRLLKIIEMLKKEIKTGDETKIKEVSQILDKATTQLLTQSS